MLVRITRRWVSKMKTLLSRAPLRKPLGLLAEHSFSGTRAYQMVRQVSVRTLVAKYTSPLVLVLLDAFQLLWVSMTVRITSVLLQCHMLIMIQLRNVKMVSLWVLRLQLPLYQSHLRKRHLSQQHLRQQHLR